MDKNIFQSWSVCFLTELKFSLVDKLLLLLWIVFLVNTILTWGIFLELNSD